MRGFGLCKVGAIVQVTLSPLRSGRQAIAERSEAAPPVVSGYAQIDTGASATCFDRSAAERAGLEIFSSKTVTSATGTEKVSIYAGRLEIAGFTSIVTRAALGMELDSLDLIALIGRDVLANCILVYNGPENSFSLSN